MQPQNTSFILVSKEKSSFLIILDFKRKKKSSNIWDSYKHEKIEISSIVVDSDVHVPLSYLVNVNV